MICVGVGWDAITIEVREVAERKQFYFHGSVGELPAPEPLEAVKMRFASARCYMKGLTAEWLANPAVPQVGRI